MILKYQYLEERAEALRLMLQEPGWLSTHAAERLAATLKPLVEVNVCSVSEAFWHSGRRGRSVIEIPETMARWHRNRRLLHELAHPLLNVGFVHKAGLMTADERAKFSQATRATEHEEMLAEVIVHALQMPSRLVVEIGDVATIARESGFPYDPVARRLRLLRGHSLTLTWLPYWCAGRCWQLAYRSGPRPCLYALDEEVPVFEWPVAVGNRNSERLRLCAELAALRPCEFRAKHHAYRLDRPPTTWPFPVKPLPIDMGELRNWAGMEKPRC